MSITIPSGIIGLFNSGIDALFNSPIAKQCTVYYPPHKEKCNNCTSFNMVGGGSNNKYITGGPMPFLDGSICPMCGGNGYRAIQATDTLNCLIFLNAKDFQVFGTIPITANSAMIEGYMSDYPKIQKMDFIIINSNEIGAFRCKKRAEWITKGFGHNRYFIQMLERI